MTSHGTSSLSDSKESHLQIRQLQDDPYSAQNCVRVFYFGCCRLEAGATVFPV